MFNTLQHDEATKELLKTYENRMDQFTRFQVQLIAKENGIQFEWGVTSKPLIIAMMKERNINIPTQHQMASYMANHRKRADEQKPIAVNVVVEQVSADENNSIVEDEKDSVVDYTSLKRGQLIKIASERGIKNPLKKKNIELIKELQGG